MNQPIEMARLHWAHMASLNQRMDDELRSAKNKRGIYLKYLHSIRPRSMKEDPWTEDAGDEGVWWNAGIAIGSLIHERLSAFAAEHNIK